MTLKQDLSDLALMGADPIIFIKVRMFLELCEKEPDNSAAAEYMRSVQLLANLIRITGEL